MRLLVTDGEQRASLAIVRSLGRAGHEVWVAARSRMVLAAASRFCAKTVALPDPLCTPEVYRQALVQCATQNRFDAIFPVTDGSLEAALEVRSDLERAGVLVPFAPLSHYRAISDKTIVLEQARSVGIAVPLQIEVTCREALGEIDVEALPYPVVIKPARSVAGTSERRRKTSVQYAETPSRLLDLLGDLAEDAYPVLLQERIAGAGAGIFLLRWNGRICAAFAHRRLREKPPSGGVSVLRDSVPMDGALLERSTALLESFEWQGPAMIEYKLHETTGEPYLMEINGRYWGSLQLAIDSGVDFPALHLELADSGDATAVTRYAVGVQTRWVLGDLDHLIARLRAERGGSSRARSASGKGRAILDFLRAFRPGVRNEILHWSDPFPAVVELVRWFPFLRGQDASTAGSPPIPTAGP